MAVGEDLKVQVMMVGGRRCGKTTILAAMKSNFEEQFAKTRLTVSFGDLDTLEVLEAKNNEIADYFLGAESRTFSPDSNPTEDMMRYTFSIGIAEKRGKIKVDFVDYPGEWLTDKEHKNDLLDCMKNTQAVIVAIDTPHLMEEDGRFNEYRNFCRRTGEMLKMALEETPATRRLILFVPLKCERYLNDEKMEEVCAKTEESYVELIRYLARSQKKSEVAVTPIFTLGGAEFSHFERDKQTGEIKINEKYHTPEKAVYCFPDITVKKPEPKYCEQPIVYLLAYLMQLAGDKKSNQYDTVNIWGKFGIRFQEWFLHTISASDYLTQKSVVLQRLKKQDDGYHIVQNPMKF